MLWYIISVIIYFIIYILSFYILRKKSLKIQERLEKSSLPLNKSNWVLQLASLCWIPIIRVLFIIAIYSMCFCSDETYNKVFTRKEEK